MDQYWDNPRQNNLGNGVSAEDLLAAIDSSGYPLQSVAVDALLSALGEYVDPLDSTAKYGPLQHQVQEEWSYFDSESGSVRQIDAFISVDVTPAEFRSYEPITSRPQDFLRYHLDLLLECKQAELPYVFFLRTADAGEVPRLLGLPHDKLAIRYGVEEGGYAIITPFYNALGLGELSFAKEPPTAISMSRASRRGKGLELSGEELFRSITLPLTKALAHYEQLTVPTGAGRLHFPIHLTVLIAVIRAPMVAVHMDNGRPRIEARPWIRLVRVDPDEEWHQSYSRAVAIDVVHIDYLPVYVPKLREAAAEIAQKLSGQAISVLTGEAAGLEESSEISRGRPRFGASLTTEQFMAECQRKARESHA